jgi:hypothetical protein
MDDEIGPERLAARIGAAVERLRTLAAAVFEADANAGLFDEHGGGDGNRSATAA